MIFIDNNTVVVNIVSEKKFNKIQTYFQQKYAIIFLLDNGAIYAKLRNWN